MGRGELSDISFSSENTEKLDNILNYAKEKFGDFIFENPEYLLNNEKSAQEYNCGAGTKSLTLTPQGNLKLCPMDDYKQVFLGNIQDESLTTLLLDLQKIDLYKLTDPRVEVCGDCEHLIFCEHCIVRGLQMYDKIGDKCSWFKKIDLTDFKGRYK